MCSEKSEPSLARKMNVLIGAMVFISVLTLVNCGITAILLVRSSSDELDTDMRIPSYPEVTFSEPQGVEPSSDSSEFLPTDPEAEDLIRESAVIAIVRYQPPKNGKVHAKITEILKKDAGVVFYYKVGDLHPSSAFYPRPNTSRGDGSILFFKGNPATETNASAFYGDRIAGFGDMPMGLFRKIMNRKLKKSEQKGSADADR